MARPRLVALVGAASLAVLWGPAAPLASADAPPAPGGSAGAPYVDGNDLAVRADGIADDITARWTLLQRSDGRFPDPVAGTGEDYGTAMLGLAMARRGAERGDRDLVRSGLAAILAEVERPTNGAFEPLVLAEAYRWGSQHLSQAAGVSDLWPDAEAKLRADLIARPPAGAASVAVRCINDPVCWNNLKLVGALGGAVLQRTGLTSQVPGSLLADATLTTQIQSTASVIVPGRTGSGVARHGTAAVTSGGILSDPPRDPLAYHVLSTAMLGRLIEELGPAATLGAREALERADRALLLLAAPTGDLTWWGRGQGQSWVPAVTAEAAARAASLSSPKGHLRGRYLALAEAALQRLRSDYGIGAYGLPLVPGATDAATLATRAVDPYATTRGYNGLAVDALDRAASLLRGNLTQSTSVPAARPGSVRSPKQAGLVTLSRGGAWVAISGRARATEDARYGSGVLALQARSRDGLWTDRVPARPFTPARSATLAIRVAGTIIPASGEVLETSSSTTAQLFGGWSAPGTGRTIDAGTRWWWTIGDDRSVTASFRPKRARTVVASALAGDGDQVTPTPRGARVTALDGTTVSYEITVNGRAVAITRNERMLGGSAYDQSVRAFELSFRAPKGARVALRIRPAGAPPIAGG
ncbi:MAG: hypothetical protein J7513_11575 [Solirubrobacteraceae bacterium]|nr:hypothetical protein [Solirubrobacteraceae bacterium]